MIYDQYKTKSETVEKAIFVGPFSAGIAVMDALHADGWRLTRSGPYTDRAMFPKMDPERFLFHAEKEITPAKDARDEGGR